MTLSLLESFVVFKALNQPMLKNPEIPSHVTAKIEYCLECLTYKVCQGDKHEIFLDTCYCSFEGFIFKCFKQSLKGRRCIQTLFADSSKVLQHLPNPFDTTTRSVYGIIYCQTYYNCVNNVKGLVCRLCDIGYTVFLIITSNKENKREEMNSQLREAFINECLSNGIPINNPTDKSDINGRNEVIQYDKNPLVIVTKKNKSTLLTMNELLKLPEYTGIVIMDVSNGQRGICVRTENFPNCNIVFLSYYKSSNKKLTAKPDFSFTF